MSDQPLSTDCVAAMAAMAGAAIPEERLATVAGTLAAFGPLLSVVRDTDVTHPPAARFQVAPWEETS